MCMQSRSSVASASARITQTMIASVVAMRAGKCEVVAPEAGLADTDVRVPGPVKPWYCDACWDEWEAWPDRCEGCGEKHCECAREYCEGCAQRHAYCCCRMPPAA